MSGCPCGWNHPTWAVRVAGRRFGAGSQPRAFHAYPGGPSRATRAEAMRDVCPHWASPTDLGPTQEEKR